MAEIVKVQFGNFGKVWCEESGLRFPQIFRVTAFEWDFSDESAIVATDRRAPTCYSLDRSIDWQIHANPTFTPIDAPDPAIDKGWIIIRHHRTHEHADGYLTALADYEQIADFYDGAIPKLYEINGEIFTLVHRPAIPGKPDPAMVYSTHIVHQPAGLEDFWDLVEGGVRLRGDELFIAED